MRSVRASAVTAGVASLTVSQEQLYADFAKAVDALETERAKQVAQRMVKKDRHL